MSKAKGLLLGALAISACVAGAVPAQAQSNPFVPGTGASTSEMNRLIDQKIQAAIAKQASDNAKKPGAGAPGTAGATAVPGAPGSPLAPGTPGAAIPPGVPGAPGVLAGPPVDQTFVLQQRTATTGLGQVKFIGCINGEPKFKRTTGERVSFTRSEIDKAVKAGDLPECR